MKDIEKLRELATEFPNITIAVKLSDLIEWHEYVIENIRLALEESVISSKAETYPSPKQVCEILDVNLSTLWRWEKSGYLCHIEVGGKRRYRMSDIKTILNGGKKVLTKTPISEWIYIDACSQRLKDVLLRKPIYNGGGDNDFLNGFEYIENVTKAIFLRQTNAGYAMWNEFERLLKKSQKL